MGVNNCPGMKQSSWEETKSWNFELRGTSESKLKLLIGQVKKPLSKSQSLVAKSQKPVTTIL